MMPLPILPDFADFFDTLIEGFGDAVTDVRHTLVEEGWFGKEVTGDIQRSNEVERSMDEFYGLTDLDDNFGLDNARLDYEKEQIGKDDIDMTDHDFDR